MLPSDSSVIPLDNFHQLLVLHLKLNNFTFEFRSVDTKARKSNREAKAAWPRTSRVQKKHAIPSFC
jgi:hypothetical protein